MFESNYPADKQSFSYNVIWNAYKRVARALELTAEQTAHGAQLRETRGAQHYILKRIEHVKK